MVYNGKPVIKMDHLEGKNSIFGSTPICYMLPLGSLNKGRLT